MWEGRGAKELWQGLRGYSALVEEEIPEMINSIFSLKINKYDLPLPSQCQIWSSCLPLLHCQMLQVEVGEAVGEWEPVEGLQPCQGPGFGWEVGEG